jgi:hypothetical protein
MSTFLTPSDVTATLLPDQGARIMAANSPNGSSLSPLISAAMIPESAFQTTAAQRAYDVALNQNMGARNEIVRGVQGKNETYATLEILQPGSKNPLLKFEEFLLQTVSEASQERFQSIETFGDTIGFFFGSRPKFYTYTGTLLNTADYGWKDKWTAAYETQMRGTKCVEQKARAYLTYDYVLREGYILQMNVSQISAHPNHVDFSFSMFVTREISLNNVQATGIAIMGGMLTNAVDSLKSTVVAAWDAMGSLAGATLGAAASEIIGGCQAGETGGTEKIDPYTQANIDANLKSIAQRFQSGG